MWDEICKQFYKLKPEILLESSEQQILDVKQLSNWKFIDKTSFCDVMFCDYVEERVQKGMWFEKSFIFDRMKIHIYYSEEENIRKKAMYMVKCRDWLSSVLNLPIINEWNVTLWLTPFKKYFTKNMTPKHVNSGETFSQNGITYISIWREEEWSKVFIHEALHALKWEDSFFLRSTKTNVVESWIEFWAQFFHVLTISCRGWRQLWIQKIKEFRKTSQLLFFNEWKASKTSVKGYYLYKYAWASQIPIDEWENLFVLKINWTQLLKYLWKRTKETLNS